MGGHETLLLVARYPRLLAGAASFDGVSDFGLQYRNFPQLGCNAVCRRIWSGTIARACRRSRAGIGGSPATAPIEYAARSAITQARAIADSCVPLQIWWSTADLIVRDSNRQSGHLLALVQQLNPTRRLRDSSAHGSTRLVSLDEPSPVRACALRSDAAELRIEASGATPPRGTWCLYRLATSWRDR